MRAISYPFTLSNSGKILAASDINKIYQDRLLTLISTIVRQRVMRPTYGTDLGRGMYENAGNMTLGMESAIREAVAKWLPEISIQEYTTTPPNENGVATVNLSAILPGNQVTTQQLYMTPDGKVEYVRNA